MNLNESAMKITSNIREKGRKFFHKAYSMKAIVPY